jgi:Rha family phage regulatory protein
MRALFIFEGGKCMKAILNPEYQLYERDGRSFCDSLQVAEAFKRQHKHIIRTIEALTEPRSGLTDDFRMINFCEAFYRDASGKKNKKYLLTRDGFTMVVMEFKTAKARQFKEMFINRFNQMESFIQTLQATKIEFPAFTEAVLMAHEEPKHYHFSNEINMIYRIILGVDAKKYRETHGIPAGEVIKPYLTGDEIKWIEALQRIDVGLLEAGFDYEMRKRQLETSYTRRIKRLAG